MAGYIDVPTDTNPDSLTDRAVDYLVANIPGFELHDGHLEGWFFAAVARMVAEGRDVASRVPEAIFRYFGQTLIGLAPIEAASAKTTSTWTMVDNQGYTIGAGTQVAFRTAGDTLVPFTVDEDVTVPAGSVTTAAGEVALTAVDAGTAANDIAAGPMELIDALAFVSTIDSTLPTSGGVDTESDDAYLDRLADELAIQSPRPILPRDFAVLARRVAGVHRALAIDGYNPVGGTFNNERMIAVAVVDAAGNAVALAVKNAVAAALEAQREINFVVNVIDPTKTAVNVDFTFTVQEGYVPADVEARAEQAVADYLDPAVWGGGDEDPPQWRGDGVVRFLEVATLLNNVAGVNYLTALTLNGGGANVALPGVAPLPTPGVINGTSV